MIEKVVPEGKRTLLAASFATASISFAAQAGFCFSNHCPTRKRTRAVAGNAVPLLDIAEVFAKLDSCKWHRGDTWPRFFLHVQRTAWKSHQRHSGRELFSVDSDGTWRKGESLPAVCWGNGWKSRKASLNFHPQPAPSHRRSRQEKKS